MEFNSGFKGLKSPLQNATIASMLRAPVGLLFQKFGFFMDCPRIYHQLHIQQFYVLPTHCIYVFYVDLRTNSDYFPIQHRLVGFCNLDGECLLRGTD